MDPVTPAQSRAAHAYAEVLLGNENAGPTAEDALAAFRQTVGARGEAVSTSALPAADETLLALTRLMTAVSMPDRSSPEDRRQAVWASISSGSHCTCRESAALLATRANGNIQPRESAALDEHLATCAECSELSVRSGVADTAFYDQLKPAAGGGFGLPGAPRAAFALAAALIVAGSGAVVLATHGGGSHATGSNAAQVTAVQTQTATTVGLQLTTTAATKPAPRHARAIKPTTHHRTVTTPRRSLTLRRVPRPPRRLLSAARPRTRRRAPPPHRRPITRP
jgi:hypothetical protein